MKKYLLVGGLTYCLDLIVFNILLELDLNIIICNFLSGSVAILFNFNATYFFVFDHNSHYLRSLLRYLVSFVLERGINTLQVVIWTNLFSMPILSKILASLIQSPLSYYLNKKFVLMDSLKKNSKL